MSLEPASSSTAPSTTERTLARLSTLLSSTSGIDKAYRLLIYSLRILALSTAKRHGPQHPLVTGVAAFTGPLADTRVVLRMFGLLPMVQEVLRLRRESIAHAASAASSAVSSSSASASGNGTRKTGTDNALLGLTPALIERLQVWAMLVYYPCEHVYWLGEHKVFPSSWIREPYWWSRVSCRAVCYVSSVCVTVECVLHCCVYAGT